MENHSWTPTEIAAIPITQMVAFFISPPPPLTVTLVNPTKEQRWELINRLRAKKGLAPLVFEPKAKVV